MFVQNCWYGFLDKSDNKRSQIGVNRIVKEHDFNLPQVHLDVVDVDAEADSCLLSQCNKSHIDGHVNLSNAQDCSSVDLPGWDFATDVGRYAHIDIPTKCREVVFCFRRQDIVRPLYLQPLHLEV